MELNLNPILNIGRATVEALFRTPLATNAIYKKYLRLERADPTKPNVAVFDEHEIRVINVRKSTTYVVESGLVVNRSNVDFILPHNVPFNGLSSKDRIKVNDVEYQVLKADEIADFAWGITVETLKC